MIKSDMARVKMIPEQEKLVNDAGYLMWVREKTAYVLSRGPNGKKAEMRYR
jgi:hypothetical protein